MIRIPDVDRFELRLADGATNPYLLQAGVIAGGPRRLAQQRDPGPRRDNNMYTHPLPPRRCAACPRTCSTRCARCAQTRRWPQALGAPFVDAYTKLKEHEWHEHQSHISPWERQSTLDC